MTDHGDSKTPLQALTEQHGEEIAEDVIQTLCVDHDFAIVPAHELRRDDAEQ